LLDNPLYRQESEAQAAGQDFTRLKKQLGQMKKSDQLYLEEIRIKHRAVMDKHIESYLREFGIKFSTDSDLAVKHLQISKDHYMLTRKMMEEGYDLGDANQGSIEGQKKIEKLKMELNRKRAILREL
jgi:hypothetical protein